MTEPTKLRDMTDAALDAMLQEARNEGARDAAKTMAEDKTVQDMLRTAEHRASFVARQAALREAAAIDAEYWGAQTAVGRRILALIEKEPEDD